MEDPTSVQLSKLIIDRHPGILSGDPFDVAAATEALALVLAGILTRVEAVAGVVGSQSVMNGFISQLEINSRVLRGTKPTTHPH